MRQTGLRFGFVDKKTEDGLTYPVRFDDRDRQVIDMYAVRERHTETAYAEGDHVACLLSDEGDAGVILGLIKPSSVREPGSIKIAADLDLNGDMQAAAVSANGVGLTTHIHQAPGGFGGPTSGPTG